MKENPTWLFSHKCGCCDSAAQNVCSCQTGKLRAAGRPRDQFRNTEEETEGQKPLTHSEPDVVDVCHSR